MRALVLFLLFLTVSTQEKSTCFQDPSQPWCSDADLFYDTEAVLDDINSVCTHAPWLSGCSIKRSCEDGRMNGNFCLRWSLLSDLCSAQVKEDVKGLAGCSNYTKLCQRNDTAVRQCKDPNLQHVPGLISSQQSLESVSALCKEMPDMQGCSQCSAATFASCPDPLGTLSRLCLSMMMADCKPWSEMCAESQGGLTAFCGEDSEGECSGVMQMYFHFGFNDYILFKRWVPCSVPRYTWSCLAIILMGVMDILLKVAKLRLEISFALSEAAGRESSEAEESTSSELLEMTTSLRRNVREMEDVHLLPQSYRELRQNMCRGALAGMTLALDYSLMFIAMTFNVGLFTSVCLGIGFGHVLFGHHFKLNKDASKTLQRACCS
mmetsp:Transcript_26078/g.85778  ORF Transcript_26078/g.85778 Transcript_26078/m.85778 type:complete len:378 (-) Transcript_26078:1641-2774(-)